MSPKNKGTEKKQSLPLFRREALEAKGERLFGEVLIIQPLSFKVLTYFLLGILVVALVFLFLGSFTKKETVRGFLMPDKGISKIFVTDPGTVSKVFVNEGDRVQAGDPLFSISLERALNSGGGVGEQLLDALKTQIDLTEFQITEEKKLAAIRENKLKNDIAAFREELVHLKNRLGLQKQITADAKNGLEIAEGLAEQGYVSQLDLTQRRNSYLNSLAAEASLAQQIEQTENLLKSKNSDLAASPGLAENAMNRLRSDLAELRQRMAQIQGQTAYTVTSPVAGRIAGKQALPGMTTNPASPLMIVLPENSRFQVELFVPTRAIGLIKPGQRVRIFYDAFRYQSFGIYTGFVVEISKTILSPEEVSGPLTLTEPVYRIIARLETQEVEGFGETFPLQAGMTLEAVIVLEEQTFFEMLLEPLKALKGRT